MTRFQAKLTSESIRALIDDLQAYKDSLEGRCEEFCRKLAELGLETAVSIVPVQTGTLKSNLGLVRQGERDYLVVADDKVAAFVEFGTGVVGENDPYPDSDVLSEAGWEYRFGESNNPGAHDPNDMGYWYWLGDSGQWIRWNGRKPAGFMLGAAGTMRANVAKVAKEVFRHD